MSEWTGRCYRESDRILVRDLFPKKVKSLIRDGGSIGTLAHDDVEMRHTRATA
jgi:hypothetical protein